MSIADMGRVAYEAYCDKTAWRSAVTGAQLPPWEAQLEPVKDAWRAAAKAVIEAWTYPGRVAKKVDADAQPSLPGDG